MSRRFHPYSTYRPILSAAARDLLPPRTAQDIAQDDRHTAAYRELQRLNIVEKKLVTWDHNLNVWKELPRPQRVSGTRKVDIAASGFNKAYGKYNAPYYCPHLRRSGLHYDPLVLTLAGAYEGGTADYYRAVDHPCIYRVVVPPLRERRTLLTWDDQKKFLAEQDDDMDEEDGPTSSPPTSSIQSASSLAPSSSLSSISSFTSGTSATSATSVSSAGSEKIAQLYVEAALKPHPRAGSHRVQVISTPPRPLAVSGGSVLGGRTVRSIYSKTVADARKLADVGLMEYLHQIESSGLLGEDPTSHPAWDPEDPPSILQIYDQRIYPDCITRTFQHLDYLYKPLSQAIREMNLALGIPYADYCTLIRSTQACNACLNHFSPDGYAHHRRDGLCSNHPDLAPIPEGELFTGEIRLRSFVDDTSPSFRGETLNSSVGSALLEWNSRLGIPADVWMMASTAVVHCSSCDLVRSFPAHLIHLDNSVCNDPGQKLIIRS